MKACELIKELAQIVSEEGDCEVVMKLNVEGQDNDDRFGIRNLYLSKYKTTILLESDEIQIPF